MISIYLHKHKVARFVWVMICIWAVKYFLSLSVFDGNFGFSENFSTSRWCIEDPISSTFDLVNPGITFKAALCTEDFFEPDLFPDSLEDVLVTDLLHFIFRVDVLLHRACHQCQLEYICRGKWAHLVEDGSKVFISRRDLRVFLEPTVLQDAVECVCLINWLTAAVHQSKAFEPIHIDLICSLILLCVLKRCRK